jgi:cytochrome oxidase assembly protein ShyY1
MYRFLFRPKWIAFHVVIAVLVIVMVNLAFWQLRRLHDRQAFNREVTSHANAAIEPLADVLQPGTDPSTVEWRRVQVTGTYLPGREVQVVNRSQNGAAGRNAVDPLRLDDGTILLVNRGFVPGVNAIPPVPTGTVTLLGQLRVSEVRTLGEPDDASGVVLTEVRRLDVAKLSPQMGGTVQPMSLQLLQSTPREGQYPQPVAQPVLDEGPHLSYTLQWLFFSLCAIVGWVLAVRRSVAMRSGKRSSKKRRGPPPIADELSRV